MPTHRKRTLGATDYQKHGPSELQKAHKAASARLLRSKHNSNKTNLTWDLSCPSTGDMQPTEISSDALQLHQLLTAIGNVRRCPCDKRMGLNSSAMSASMTRLF